MPSVTFDSVELVNSTYAPKYIKHESAPERELILLDLAREGGSVLITEKYGVKVITVSGSLKATSASTLEIAIDSFKELFSRIAKNLDIGWGSGTRRYVATCVKHTFDRSHFNINFIPWTAQFVVPTGIGEDISETTLVSNQNFTAVSYASSMSFLGSNKPNPRIRVKCGVSATDPKGLSIENTDNGERIVITRASGFGANKYFEMDCRLKTVEYDGSAIDFYGVLPDWIVGANDYKIMIGDIVDQAFTETTPSVDENPIYGGYLVAQSFSVPYTNATYQGIKLYLRRFGTLANDLVVEIWNDIGGEPNPASKVSNATFSLAKATPTTSWVWYTLNSASVFTLSANTKYWIVLTSAGGDASNYWAIPYRTGAYATYKRGNKSQEYTGSWSDQPNQDMLFQLLYGGKADAAKTYYFDVYYFKRFL